MIESVGVMLTLAVILWELVCPIFAGRTLGGFLLGLRAAKNDRTAGETPNRP
jgi:hypothetical protein